MPSPRNRRVLALACEHYDGPHIERLICTGMAELGLRPRGNVFVKPTVVFAGAPEVFGADACTQRSVVGAALRALAKSPGVRRVVLGENSAIGFPTRHCYRHAGYYGELAHARRDCPVPIDIVYMDEQRRDPVFVGGVVHDVLRLARTMARASARRRSGGRSATRRATLAGSTKTRFRKTPRPAT